MYNVYIHTITEYLYAVVMYLYLYHSITQQNIPELLSTNRVCV